MKIKPHTWQILLFSIHFGQCLFKVRLFWLIFLYSRFFWFQFGHDSTYFILIESVFLVFPHGTWVINTAKHPHLIYDPLTPTGTSLVTSLRFLSTYSLSPNLPSLLITEWQKEANSILVRPTRFATRSRHDFSLTSRLCLGWQRTLIWPGHSLSHSCILYTAPDLVCSDRGFKTRLAAK